MKIFLKRRNLLIKCIILLVLIIVPFSLLPLLVRGENGEAYWPTNEWIVTTPEEQGMDSNILNGTYEYIEDTSYYIESVMIIRNGYIVNEHFLQDSTIIDSQTYENYVNPNIRYGRLHALFSCTKSVVSLLVGIAIDKGFIEDVNQTFFEIFPDKWNPKYGDETKKNISIKHLLTMTAGLDWSDELSGEFATNISLNYILEQPLEAVPGELFHYSSGSVQLLSAIIQNRTGLKTSEFARQHLFEPIGINGSDWEWDEWDEMDSEWGNGSLDKISYGGFGIYMTPRAMGRIGLLCLTNGLWNGTQVISEEWITAASKIHYGNPYYGYLFWLGYEFYYAAGYLGQTIYIIPEYDTVVVFTATVISPYDLYEYIIHNYILDAINQFTDENRAGVAIPGIPLITLMLITVITLSLCCIIVKKKIINEKSY